MNILKKLFWKPRILRTDSANVLKVSRKQYAIYIKKAIREDSNCKVDFSQPLQINILDDGSLRIANL